MSIQDAVAFLRAAGGPEDTAVITSLIAVAREFVEDFTGQALISSGWRLTSDTWTGGEITWGGDVMTIDRSPLVSVASVKYYADGETALTTMDAADYTVITDTDRGFVMLNIAPPSLADRPDAVQINFTAGRASPQEIQPTLLHAVRLLVAHFYELRTPVNVGNSVNDIPLGLTHILESQRVAGFVA